MRDRKVFTRRDAMVLGGAAMTSLGSPGAEAAEDKAPPIEKSYPSFLTSRGLTGWRPVFDPDFTLPPAQLVASNCTDTPFSYRGPFHDGRVYAKNQSGSGFRQTGSGLELLLTERMQSSLFTVDHDHRGKSWNAPVYFEGQCIAEFGRPNDGCYYTFFTQCRECYDSKHGGSRDGTAPFRRGELDLTEVYLDPQFGMFDEVYASTIIPDCGPTGPLPHPSPYSYGLSKPHADPAAYGVAPSPLGTKLWGRPVTWGALWLPDKVSFSRDNIHLATFETPPGWTSPTLRNGDLQTFWFSAFIIESTFTKQPPKYRDTMVVRFMRVWQPA
jgi:hypothetical protein